MPHVVYAIIDPRIDRIFYIGHTGNFELRKKQHLNGSHGACAVWIDRIQKGGLKPLFLILKRYNTYTQSLNGEKFWIETFKSQGVNLANKENPALNFPACAGKPWTAS